MQGQIKTLHTIFAAINSRLKTILTTDNQLGLILALVGPTASGKSALAIKIAQCFNGEIVNADAYSLYRYMDIGTSKPSKVERELIPHFQIDQLEPCEEASVAAYQKNARRDIEDILKKGKLPILVGGSGLYVNACLYDLNFPPTDFEIRQKYQNMQTEELVSLLRDKDIVASKHIEPNNHRRLARALEVIELTGKPFTASLPAKGKLYFNNVEFVGLKPNLNYLDDCIVQRTNDMRKNGLLKEILAISNNFAGFGKTAARAIGYKEFLPLLQTVNGKFLFADEQNEEIDQAFELVNIHTRQLVRKQIAWFKRDLNIKWLNVN